MRCCEVHSHVPLNPMCALDCALDEKAISSRASVHPCSAHRISLPISGRQQSRQCLPIAGVDWNMVAKYVDISDALPTLDAAEDSDKGSDKGSDSGSDSGGGAADEPSRRVAREVQGSHASWTERIGLAQVSFIDVPQIRCLSLQQSGGCCPRI